MTKKKKKRHIVRNIFISFLCASLLGVTVWYFFFGGKTYYQYTFHGNHEPFTLRSATSTDPLYSEEQFRKSLENTQVGSMYDVDLLVKDSIVIPGLKATRNIVKKTPGTMDICTSMTPQGVTATDEYVFISAYCHTKEHNTVLYMIDRKSHEFMKEIILPDQSHAGSITYDPENKNLWICCYDKSMKLPSLSVISLEHIQEYNFDDRFEPISYDSTYPLLTILHASYMTYYDHAIYVGNFTSKKEDETLLERFDLEKDGTIATTDNPLADINGSTSDMIVPSVATAISGQMQGVAFCNGLAAMIQSYGSVDNSKMYFFDAEDPSSLYEQTVSMAITTIELPPMAEEIAVYNNNTILIAFESGAYAYRARDCIHMDRILVIDTSVE